MSAEANGSRNSRPITPEMLARGITREMDLGRIDADGVREAYEILEEQGRIPRIQVDENKVIEKDGYTLDQYGKFHSSVTNLDHQLTAKEGTILRQLMLNSPYPLSITKLLNLCRFNDDTTDSTITVHIGKIRSKIDTDPPQLIHTRRGFGYYFQRKPIPGAS